MEKVEFSNYWSVETKALIFLVTLVLSLTGIGMSALYATNRDCEKEKHHYEPRD